MKEFEFGGEHFAIKKYWTPKGGKGCTVRSEGFVASLQGLKILYYQSHGHTKVEAGKELGVSVDTIKEHERELIRKNEELTGQRKSLLDLTHEAEKRELLFPYTLQALEAIAEK